MRLVALDQLKNGCGVDRVELARAIDKQLELDMAELGFHKKRIKFAKVIVSIARDRARQAGLQR